MSIPYRFLPWARRGLARSHRNADDGGQNLAVRPKITVGLSLQAKQDGNVSSAVSGNIDLTLYGPGDILGIDRRLIVRTEPKPNATNFEPNYLAAVDFDPPDFPWLLTPAKANGQHNLRPWLVLIVIDRSRAGVFPQVKAGRPLPSIKLTTEQAASELPDLAESWLWAHAQAVSTQSDASGLGAELQQKPERNISRLVCLRRLEARKDYLACVVPAFEAGRLRGLGMPVPENMTQLLPAWSGDQDVELPIYYHWEFSTGPVGDIETLARRLRTPQQYQGDAALLAQLRHIGERPVAVDGDHLLFNGTTPDRTIFEGAMVSLDFQPEPASDHPLFGQNLAAILNSGDQLLADRTAENARVPTLSPPIYGEFPAKRHRVETNNLNNHWLDQLNLQPRYRLAAGWGAELVRQNQDEFMQAAWTQVGDVLAAERALSLSRFAQDILKSIERRHLRKLPEHRLLALLGAARGRIKLAPNQSLYGKIDAATLPEELFDGALRRLTSPRRATFRMAQFRERNLGTNPPSVERQMAELVDRFANAATNVAVIDPNRFVPDGIMGSRSLDNVPLPSDPAALVDLQPYLGVPATLAVSQIRDIQTNRQTSLQQAATAKRQPPAIGDVWHQGLLTETHWARIQELRRASTEAVQGDMAQLVLQASRGGSEGVLLNVRSGGQVNAQSLRIDGRNGTIKAIGAPRTARTAAIVPGGLGAVPVSALRLYGNDAVFNSLPAGSLGGDAPVAIALRQPGRFAPEQARTGETLSITLPPAIKNQATLKRYSTAFKDYQRLWTTPQQEAKVQIKPLNFAMAQSAAMVLGRIDPAKTVPARLASMLTLAEQSLAWSPAAGFGHDFISTRLDLAPTERLRYVIPRSFDRIMAYPHLTLPLSRKLEKLAPEVFLPGVGVLPDDFIMAVKTNPRFVEALMLGANHEMGRELLWQGFPTDQRGTPFQHFWQRLDATADIEEIHRWNALPLGKQPASTEMLVLLIRGQLLLRFPTLSIYAYPKLADQKRPGGSSPPLPPGTADPNEMDPGQMVLPAMRGRLGQDITYIGFGINPADIQHFFFVLEEQMTEPRFGFDEPDGAGQNSASWLDVDWNEAQVAGGQFFGGIQLRQAPPVQQASAAVRQQWQTPHAAMVANALLQRPFRGYYAGAALKMPN